MSTELMMVVGALIIGPVISVFAIGSRFGWFNRDREAKHNVLEDILREHRKQTESVMETISFQHREQTDAIVGPLNRVCDNISKLVQRSDIEQQQRIVDDVVARMGNK